MKKIGVKYHIDALNIKMKLVGIAVALGLKRTGSIPTTIKKLKNLLGQDRSLLKKVERIKSRYDT